MTSTQPQENQLIPTVGSRPTTPLAEPLRTGTNSVHLNSSNTQNQNVRDHSPEIIDSNQHQGRDSATQSNVIQTQPCSQPSGSQLQQPLNQSNHNIDYRNSPASTPQVVNLQNNLPPNTNTNIPDVAQNVQVPEMTTNEFLLRVNNWQVGIEQQIATILDAVTNTNNQNTQVIGQKRCREQDTPYVSDKYPRTQGTFPETTAQNRKRTGDAEDRVTGALANLGVIPFHNGSFRPQSKRCSNESSNDNVQHITVCNTQPNNTSLCRAMLERNQHQSLSTRQSTETERGARFKFKIPSGQKWNDGSKGTYEEDHLSDG